MNEHPLDPNGRVTTTAGFAVGDRVGVIGTQHFGKVAWVGGCSVRNEPSCYRVCANIRVEFQCHDYHGPAWPAGDLEHLD